MGFPLIQQPAPLMQLAQTLAAIRERRDARLQAQEERRLAAARDDRAERFYQLQVATQAAAQQHQAAQMEVTKRTLENTIQNTSFTQERLLRAERLAETTRKRTEAVSRAFMAIPEIERERVGVPPELLDATIAGQAGARKNFTEGVAPEVQSANLASRQRAPNLGTEYQQAQGRARPGLSGDVVRAPQAGVSDRGLTYVPGSANLSAPSPLGGDPLLRAAITGAYEQMELMEQMEANDPAVARTPGVFNTIEQAGNIPLVGGALRGALEPTAQQALTPGQRAYRGMRREFIHTYASSLPGRRLGPELLRLLEVAFFEQAGNTDPAVTAMFRERRREAATRMYRAAQGQDVDLESVLPVDVRTRLNALPADAGTADPTAPPAPRINPRFLQ